MCHHVTAPHPRTRAWLTESSAAVLCLSSHPAGGQDLELDLCKGARPWGLLSKVNPGGKSLTDPFTVFSNSCPPPAHELAHRSRDSGQTLDTQLSGTTLGSSGGKSSSALGLWATVSRLRREISSRDFCRGDTAIGVCLATEMVPSFW